MHDMELIQYFSISTRAPGANDDGSGTSALLAIAKAIERKSVKFGMNVELVAFAGEEQGLLGSHAYASQSTFYPLLSGYSNCHSQTSQTMCGCPSNDPE